MTLTAAGFERPRLPEIKLDYDARVTNALGAVNTNADSIIGQLEGIWAEGIDNSYESLQNTYDAMYPFSAEGVSLDGAVAFVGMERLKSSATVVTAIAYGDEGSLVPIGSLAHADIQYFSTSDVVISRANTCDASLEVLTVSNSTAYNVIVGGVSSTFTSDASATAIEILNGLAALINSALVVAAVSGSQLRIYAVDGVTPFTLTVDVKLSIVKRGSPVVFVAITDGAFACPVGALSNIDSPALGWASLYNLAAGAIGRDTETDTELRLRHASSVRATGSATVESIKSRMLAALPSVTSIKIYENRTSITTVDGIPPHAFQCVIVGGADAAIASQLWLTKPAGIETHGNVSNNVIDTNGDAQIVKFSRSTPKYAWVTVAVTLLNTEEALSVSAVSSIKSSIVAFANTNLGAGDDIILQKFYGAIYGATGGIGQVTITAAVTALPSDTPSYGSSNIAIAKTENSVFDISRVVVTGI